MLVRVANSISKFPAHVVSPVSFLGSGLMGMGGAKVKWGRGWCAGLAPSGAGGTSKGRDGSWRDLKRSRWELARPQKVSLGASETNPTHCKTRRGVGVIFE